MFDIAKLGVINHENKKNGNARLARQFFFEIIGFFFVSLPQKRKMEIKEGEYMFTCYPMPWTESDMGKGIGTIEMSVPISLTKEEIQGIIGMYLWAWETGWFENSISETVCTELMEERMPDLFNKVHSVVHEYFCKNYSNNDNLNGFGDYEIFIPDEIDDMLWSAYSGG